MASDGFIKIEEDALGMIPDSDELAARSEECGRLLKITQNMVCERS